MLARLIGWSVRNTLLVAVGTVALVLLGVRAARELPLDALPDLSDVQVIVQTAYGDQAPRIVEDQVTYPIATEMLRVPGASAVRGYSFFGVSFVYVIFADGTDLYWARSRVLEALSGLQGRLPPGATPALGPDATGLGWVFQYALEDTTGRRSVAELRTLQDWTLRTALTAVPGVAEVATVGGFESQYQVDLDPVRLQGLGVTVPQVMAALQGASTDIGAMVVELSEREYMVRGLGALHDVRDIEEVAVAVGGPTPVRIRDVGRVSVGPAVRRGIADLDGRGEAVGGIVVMRFGQNALSTIADVKARIADIAGTLPAGVVLRPVYDRSDLIHAAIATLRSKLVEECLIVALVCLVFLLHARSALVAVLTLPVGILASFVGMRAMGVGADIMSLGGIAIAIGAMIDAAIVLIENMHKHLERHVLARPGADPHAAVIDTGVLTPRERWAIVLEASREVGPALFFSLLIITVSFIPVFVLEGQEGRLFTPLALTKTFAMGASSFLAVTLVPVTMGWFVRGRIRREEANPVSRWVIRAYRPCIALVLRYRWETLAVTAAALVLSWIPWQRMGSEFMPPLDEGAVLYMPTTLPGISVARARELLRVQDSLIRTVPEVATVWGKGGRAETATDPAGFDMVETTITLRPSREWRPGMTTERIIAALDSVVRIPGVTNAWTMPIRARIDMLATGIRTPVGVKVFGPDLAELERLTTAVEGAVGGLDGVRSVFAERAVTGHYLDIAIDRDRAARLGVDVADAQAVIASAIGGMTVTRILDGRQRFDVRVRYPQELRDSPERLAAVLVPVRARPGAGVGAPATGTPGGGAADLPMGGMATDLPAAPARIAQVPLGQLATIRTVAGPMAIRTEGAQPTAWVHIDVAGRDVGGFVREARAAVERAVPMPSGYHLVWSGQFEAMERAAAAMRIVVPATLAIIVLLLYLNFGRLEQTGIVLLSLPFGLIGGVWFCWWLDYQWSVAVAIGFIALAGVAAETGVVMLIYLDHAFAAREHEGRLQSAADRYAAIMEGAVERVRPKLMTVIATMVGLFPILWSQGTGASVMKRIAAPMVGGMVTSALLTLLVIPAVYSLWQDARARRGAGAHGAVAEKIHASAP